MDLITRVLEFDWLQDDDRSYAGTLATALEELLGRSGGVESHLAMAPAEHFIVSCLVVRSIEKQLKHAPAITEDGSSKWLDMWAKACEQRRKAMKDLLEFYAKAGAPGSSSIAEVVKPLLDKAEGVYEDAVAFERRKRAKKADSGGEAGA